MYTGTSVDALTYVAAERVEMLHVPVAAGVTYSIAFDGYFGDTGLATLNWSFTEQYEFDPPVITLWSPVDGSVMPQGTTALWSGYSCYDPSPGTGLETCDGNVPNNTQIDTSVPGTFTFTVNASDGAGNLATASATYTILANPPNDDFANAESLAPEGTTTGTNLGSTAELSEPYHAGRFGTTSVWFRWTAPGDGFFSADTVGSDFDTLLALYTGTAVSDLTEIDSNNDGVGAQSAIHDATVFAGVTYSIAVAGNVDDTGNYVLSWRYEPLDDTTAPTVAISSPEDGSVFFQDTIVYAAFDFTFDAMGSGVASCAVDVEPGIAIDTAQLGPASFTVTGTDNWGNVTSQTVNYTVAAMTNDNFADAYDLFGSGRLVASNIGATLEPGEPSHAGATGGASVWFRWTAEEDAYLTVDTLLSFFDTTLAVYTGNSIDTLTEVASNNDSLGQQSRVQDLPVSAGVTYYIAVDGVDGASGQIDLDWITFTGPDFVEVSPTAGPLWVTDADHDFWLNAAAPADVDGDGDLDLAAIGYLVEYLVGATDYLVIFINDGPGAEGRWQFSTQFVDMNGLFSGESDLAFGDFDGDGDPDLAVGSEGATELYRNDDGTFVAIASDIPGYDEESNYTNAYDLRSLTFADFDNDADLDLLVPSVYDPATFSYRTALMRNDGPAADGWRFTEVSSALIDSARHAQTAWADADDDGDLDLFMANVDNFFESGYIRTYENTDGVFESAEPVGNLHIEYGLADWADYDADGDLDILVVGLILDTDGTYKTVLRIYNNVDGTHQPDTIVQSSFYPWLDLHAATWADYDSDGDVDILLTGSVIGETQIEGRSAVYVNDGGNYVPLGRELPAPVSSSGAGGSFTWLDIDGDGDLDYFVAGAYYVPGGNGLIETQMHLYRNDSLTANAPPATPTGLVAEGDQTRMSLSWLPATDDSTSPLAITYDLEVLAPGTGATFARRRPEPGNISTATDWDLKNLPAGDYLWRVRAVDAAFNGSTFAEGLFTITAAADGDNDGVADSLDNCSARPNPDQRDTDDDGFGNVCDPDLNQDGTVNFQDLQLMKDVFFTTDGDADLNGDGTVNFLDLVLMKALFFQAPGPSGVSPPVGPTG